MMLDTYIIYTILALILVLYGVLIGQRRLTKDKIFLAVCLLVVYGFIEGCRYEVGSDWRPYKELYQSMNTNSTVEFSLNSGYEYLFTLTNLILAKLGCSYQLYFGLMAVGQVLLYTIAFRKRRCLLGWVMMIYSLGNIITSQNIMRQTISIAIFVAIVPFLEHRKYVQYLIGCGVSILYHLSSMITLPFVVIGNKLFRWLDNIYVGIIGIVSSFFLGHFLTSLIQEYVPLLMTNEKYIRNLDSLDITHEYNSGLGRLYTIFVAILLVCLYKKYKNTEPNIKTTVYYRIFLIGIILQQAFANSMFLGRIPSVLVAMKIFLLPLLFKYLWDNKNGGKIIVVSMIAIMILGYYISIAGNAGGCSPFQFKF